MSAKNLVVLGGGESGTGAAILGKLKGYQVFLSDKGSLKQAYKDALQEHAIAFEEGQHSLNKIYEAHTIVISPGIPLTVPMVVECKSRGIEVISEIEFAARYTNAKLIGITGTNGKTTTTSLTYYLLKQAGLNVGLGGNIGKSFAWQVATENFDYYVLELSSFQLDSMFNTRLHIAMILNITPDHLDRYEYNFNKYIASKFRIIQSQTAEDYFIFNADDEAIQGAMANVVVHPKKMPFTLKQELSEGAFVRNNQFIIKLNNKEEFSMSIQELALQGKHNLNNTMASGIAGKILELRKELIRDSFSDFQGIEHRLEKVLNVSGIEFINDSKATNINSTWYALESMEKPTIWIVGGVDKGNDYTELMEIVKSKVKAIVALGVDNSKIIEAFKGEIEVIEEAKNMHEAVYKAFKLGAKDDAVLLSPACASFDLFDNYEDRGHQFKEAVRNL